ncbi:hypothetical protein DFH08DRAFT_938692 [Mycena albidolilacea]|uniref:Uncharacterized protein n=1 Tax=Mycena albidolilacea TaxID=1033008 RepID=A0AAD7EM91_9AGAR|nr:hypothetical protein DFH08DRAFT_938692 [Mycena albidolilacea]
MQYGLAFHAQVEVEENTYCIHLSESLMADERGKEGTGREAGGNMEARSAPGEGTDVQGRRGEARARANTRAIVHAPLGDISALGVTPRQERDEWGEERGQAALEAGVGVPRESVVGCSLRAESVDPKRRALREASGIARCVVPDRLGGHHVKRGRMERGQSRSARGGVQLSLSLEVTVFGGRGLRVAQGACLDEKGGGGKTRVRWGGLVHAWFGASGDTGQDGEKGKTGTSDGRDGEGEMRGEGVEGCSQGRRKGGGEGRERTRAHAPDALAVHSQRAGAVTDIACARSRAASVAELGRGRQSGVMSTGSRRIGSAASARVSSSGSVLSLSQQRLLCAYFSSDGLLEGADARDLPGTCRGLERAGGYGRAGGVRAVGVEPGAAQPPLAAALVVKALLVVTKSSEELTTIINFTTGRQSRFWQRKPTTSYSAV